MARPPGHWIPVQPGWFLLIAALGQRLPLERARIRLGVILLQRGRCRRLRAVERQRIQYAREVSQATARVDLSPSVPPEMIARIVEVLHPEPGHRIPVHPGWSRLISAFWATVASRRVLEAGARGAALRLGTANFMKALSHCSA
jgi:hypothetical protein